MAAIFGRFSHNSETLLVEAQNLANQLARPVGSDVVLLAILDQPTSMAAGLLKSIGVNQNTLVDHLTTPLEELEPNLRTSRAQEMKKLLEQAIALASRFRFASVEVEHILFIIAKEEKMSGHQMLKAAGVDPHTLMNRLSEWLFSVAMLSHSQSPLHENTDSRSDKERFDIERFVFDTTQAAEKGTLDPVIGRDEEIDQLIHILLRRRKNNPLLLGEPGVGKTALVDALAQRISRKAVPTALIGKRVLTLDLGLVVAGTMYRGQFEERLKGIIQEIQTQGNCILFVDEIHTLSGTGSAEGGFDAANILKPALARGEITLIGATTHEEYRKHIMKDKALERRFQTLTIEEPDEKTTIGILKGLRSELEKHHQVLIMDDAIKSAVELSVRYIHDRFLPDKAIDVLDQAATLHAEHHQEDTALSSLRQEVALVGSQKSEAALQGDYEIAKALMEKETQLLRELKKAEKLRRPKVHKPVTPTQIATVISRRTGISVDEILHTLEPLNLARVKTILNNHILGQEEAVTSISQVLMRSQLGLQPHKKPLGSFLLVGPTGVGKTETARILASEVFGDAKALIKIDMSEYMERHNVSNLIGAPAGYVGFDQGGGLTEQVRRRPYSVVLFDEVEKAHPDVFNLLLQILEDGYLTDNTGSTISFEHTLIIMTSNIGMESFNQNARIGFEVEEAPERLSERQKEELHDHINRELEDFFRPELLGRLSGTIYYNPLTKPVVRALYKRRLAELGKSLKQRAIKLESNKEVLTWLCTQYDPESGARSIDRTFLQQVEPSIIEALVKTPSATQVALSIDKDKLQAITV